MTPTFEFAKNAIPQVGVLGQRCCSCSNLVCLATIGVAFLSASASVGALFLLIGDSICNSSGVLTSQFMFFLMISRYVIDGLNQYMKGDNSPSISKENIENWFYPIPPIREQNAICAKVNVLFAIIKSIEKSLR